MPDSKIIIKIYSDDEDISSVFSAVKQLEFRDFQVECVVQKKVEINPDDILIFQITDLGSKYLNKILKIKESISNIVIFVINHNDAVLVSSLAKLGFVDLFVLPFELPKFNSYLAEIITNKSYITAKTITSGTRKDVYNIKSIVGTSSEFLKILNFAKKIADKPDINVVIFGETGTGKGLIARVIHEYSKRAADPFIDIICSAIPENLMESELFGYEPGAFTSAKTRKYGLFELAENGTLFLDEMGDLSLGIQSKLLRTIEKKLVRRLGSINDIPINARLISATNKNLEAMIRSGQFRKDLYYRLNVVSIEIPPLRQRGDDIILLANKFIEDFNQQFGKNVKRIEKELKEFIMNYPWPGNIRELRNSVERAVLLSEDSTLKLKDFSNLLQNIDTMGREKKLDLSRLPQFVNFEVNYTKTNMRELERLYANYVFEKTKENKKKTAEILGVSRPKLDSLLS